MHPGFYINLPCGGAALLLLFFVQIPTAKKASHETIITRILKLDLIGFFFFAPAAIQLILAMEWGGTKYAWSNSIVIGLFCGSFATILVFGAWEYRMGDEAMIPLHIIKRLVIWSSCLNYALFAGAMLTATYYLPVYFQSVRNASPSESFLLSSTYLSLDGEWATCAMIYSSSGHGCHPFYRALSL